MYRHVFVNDPGVFRAMRDLGPVRLIELVRTKPDVASWLATTGGGCPEWLGVVDRLLSTALTKALSGDGRVEDVYTALCAVCDEVAAEDALTDQVAGDCARYLAMVHTGAICEFDAGGSLTTSGLMDGRIDWDALSAIEREIRARDPWTKASALMAPVLVEASEAAYPLMRGAFYRVAAFEIAGNPEWTERRYDDRLAHIRDWIEAAVANGAPWLSNLNADGVPKKLSKLTSFDAMAAEADKQMRKARTYGSGDTGGVEPFFDDGGAFMLVRLTTPQALDRESAVMGHCIGDGGYDDALTQPDRLLLSLRDRNGNAHVTIEVRENKVVQAQARRNRAPTLEHEAAAKALLSSKGIAWRSKDEIGTTMVEAFRRLLGMGEPGMVTIGRVRTPRLGRNGMFE